MKSLVCLTASVLLATFARAQMLEDRADHSILARDSSSEAPKISLSLSNSTAALQAEPTAAVAAPKSNDALAPWNDPAHKDDPLAPHNDPARKDDPLAPWNSPTGSAEDLSPADRKAYGLETKEDASVAAPKRSAIVGPASAEKISPNKSEVSPSVETIGEK